MKPRVPSSAFGGLAILVLALAAGCAVGPDYHPPKVALPPDWKDATGAVNTNAPGELAQWWKTLGDPQLESLIGRAAQANFDLKAAEARVRAARSLRGVVLADFLPTIDADASANKNRRSANAQVFQSQQFNTDTYLVGFDASWEIDIFGGRRRALQAATADLQAIEADRNAVLVTLLAEVARHYLDFRGTQRRLFIAKGNIAAQQEVVDISQLRFDKGLSSELDVTQAKSLLAASKSQLPTLDTALKQSSFRLSVLLGEAPGSLDTELAAPTPIPPMPPAVPAGLPSELLRRRPDIQRSERQLAGATARIGVATAELFPKFYLTGAAGYQSLSADNLIEPASKFWSLGPLVRWRLLEYPRLKAQIHATTAQQEQILAQFNQVVLLSLEEVENAIVAYGNEQDRYTALSQSVTESRRSFDLANELYTKGLGEFLNVLIAQRALFESEDAQVQSQRTMTQNAVALYKALGGGWQVEAKMN
jgi:NodT family efflux transporter outer membrane factor (OMF) lipoprotein